MKVKLDTFDLEAEELRAINFRRTGSRTPASRELAKSFLTAAALELLAGALEDFPAQFWPASTLDEEPEGPPRSPAGGTLDDLEEVMGEYFGGHPDDDPPYGIGGDEWHLYLSWAEARDIAPEEMAAMMEARDFGLHPRGASGGGFEVLDQILQRTTRRR